MWLVFHELDTMAEFEKLKLFCSYSHSDEDEIKNFLEHIAPLLNNGLISQWYDRRIKAGENFRENIDNNLDDADIVCLFVSAKFLSSDACIAEKEDSLKLKERKGVSVIPIILSDCGWKDDPDISPLLALPTDGEPVSNFENPNIAWSNVYDGLKSVIQQEIAVRKLKICDQFVTTFLQNTDLLSKAHSQKEEILLEHIFVYPELAEYNDLREYEKKRNSENLLEDFHAHPKILIAGENHSGKTTLCKKFYAELHHKNFVPIYISDGNNSYRGKIEKKISDAFREQYSNDETLLEEIDLDRVVLLIDDFHLAKNKERLLQTLTPYRHQIIIVDEIFGLNLQDENLTSSFKHFEIEKFNPTLRNKLIRKWLELTESGHDASQNMNAFYQNIDQKTELVDSALGKSIGSGIMPAYPFFILMVINTYETFAKPLDQEITSQGYCYQALIYAYLIKRGVKNDEIDTYVNFLTELAFYLYQSEKRELSLHEFENFISQYKGQYNLPVAEKTLLANLQATKMFSSDNFNNYSFCYPYLYYFFVAKYLADHLEECKDTVCHIMNNLHKNDYAYIAVFLSHHSKHIFILKKIIEIASSLFQKYTPFTLTRDELGFFDRQADMIVQAVLPEASNLSEQERKQDLIVQDKLEELNENEETNDDDDDDELVRELRRSIKTVEVMGMVIKNRAGSLEKDKLESVFKEGMSVHLRVMQSFVELVKNEEAQQEVVEFIQNRLSLRARNKGKNPDRDKLMVMSRAIFWNINFFVLYSIITKIIHSLGSDKLTAIIETVCDREGTPAAFLVKHGILMWYNKNLQLDCITDRIKSDDFSEVTKTILNYRIVDHCRTHSVNYKEKQKIESKLGIPSIKLLKGGNPEN